jgi:hypothetical protein
MKKGIAHKKPDQYVSNKLLAVYMKLFGGSVLLGTVSELIWLSPVGDGQGLPAPSPSHFQPFIFLGDILSNSLIPALATLLACVIIRMSPPRMRLLSTHVCFLGAFLITAVSIFLLGFAAPFPWLYCSDGPPYANYHCAGIVATPGTIAVLEPTFSLVWIVAVLSTWYRVAKKT